MPAACPTSRIAKNTLLILTILGAIYSICRMSRTSLELLMSPLYWSPTPKDNGKADSLQEPQASECGLVLFEKLAVSILFTGPKDRPAELQCIPKASGLRENASDFDSHLAFDRGGHRASHPNLIRMSSSVRLSTIFPIGPSGWFMGFSVDIRCQR